MPSWPCHPSQSHISLVSWWQLKKGRQRETERERERENRLQRGAEQQVIRAKTIHDCVTHKADTSTHTISVLIRNGTCVNWASLVKKPTTVGPVEHLIPVWRPLVDNSILYLKHVHNYLMTSHAKQRNVSLLICSYWGGMIVKTYSPIPSPGTKPLKMVRGERWVLSGGWEE